MDIIDSKKFDKKLLKLLESKTGKNITSRRFDIEGIELSKKSDFIISLFSSLKFIKSITYKILFWEKNHILNEFFQLNFNTKKFDINVSYKNRKLPGILFVNDTKIDEPFLRLLLENHFNYEMAKEPALNIRVQICINEREKITVLDIYDDRGFYMYSGI